MICTDKKQIVWKELTEKYKKIIMRRNDAFARCHPVPVNEAVYVENVYSAKLEIGKYTILAHWDGTANPEHITIMMKRLADGYNAFDANRAELLTRATDAEAQGFSRGVQIAESAAEIKRLREALVKLRPFVAVRDLPTIDEALGKD